VEEKIRMQIMKKDIKNKIAVIIISLIVAVSCQGAQKKQDVHSKWQKTASEMKLSAAVEQFNTGQYEQAGAAAQQCINAGVDLPEAYLLLGKVKLVTGDFHEAKNCFQYCVHLKESSDEGWFLLGITCERLGDNSAFREYACSKALQLAPDNVDYIIAVGRIYVARRDFAAAEKFYLGKIAASPANTDLKIAAAQMYLAEKKNDKAIELYEQAHLMKPESNELLEAVGSCYVLASNWQKAGEVHRQLYERCTDETAKDRYLRIMAFAATNDGDYSTARKYYSQLTASNNTDAKLWLSMGEASLGDDLPQQALACSRKALTLKPDMPEAYLLSGSANYEINNYTQALNDFQRAVNSPADSHFAWLMTAKCYEKTGDNVQAKAAYAKAAKFQVDNELEQLIGE
jgi:tetratricopeptide (TPR) repeat protein